MLNKISKSQVIVSGATGFIGQNLIPELLNSGYEVVVIGRDEAKASKFSWYKDVKFLLLDYHVSNHTFNAKKNSSLIHLAWQGLPNYNSLFHIEDNLPKNFNFIKALVEKGVSRVLVTGTCLEYGYQYGPISVNNMTKPACPYAVAKDTLRQNLELLKLEHPFVFMWARLFYTYGKGQNSNSILAQLDLAIDRGEQVFNMSSGEQLRDYLPVDQVANQLYEIFISNKDGIYNVCSGIPISIRKLVEDRIKERKSKIKINLGYFPYPDYEPMAFWGKK